MMTKNTQWPHIAKIGLVFLLTTASCNQSDSAPQANDSGEVDTSSKLAVESEGAKQFKLRCSTCHSFEAGKGSVIGPQLTGVVGRPVGTFDGFSYSKVLMESDAIWTHELLDEFLHKPAKVFPGNRMAFGGLQDAKQRKLIIEYLDGNK